MIELKQVERVYKTGTTQNWVLRRIDLNIRQGEFITAMGRSHPQPQAARRTWPAKHRHCFSELSPARRSNRR
jgi:hypothetical protein